MELQKEAPGKPRYWAWADLMRRAFERDVLACPRCGGRMRLLATIEDPRVIRRILAHLSAVMQYSLPVVTENSLLPRVTKEEGSWTTA